MSKIVLLCLFFVFISTNLFGKQQDIEVLPSASYDRYLIYEMLVLLWAGIIGLVVIIRMKLREIKRIQDMGMNKAEKDVPLLD